MIFRYDKDIERDIIAQFFLAPAVEVERLAAAFPEAAFQDLDLKVVRGAIGRVIAAGEPLDEVSVHARLPVYGDGQRSYTVSQLADLSNGIPRRINLETLRNGMRRNSLIASISKISQILSEGFTVAGDPIEDPDRLLQDIVAECEGARKSSGVGLRTLREMAVEYLDNLDQRPGLRALRLPEFSRLNQWFCFERGTTTGIAGRPGQGKTALMVQILFSWQHLHGLFFSLEAGEAEITARVLANPRIAKKWLIKGGNLSLTDHMLLKDHARSLSETVQVTTSGYLDIGAIERTCWEQQARLTARGAGLDFVMVDYIQIMSEGTLRGRRGRYEVVGEQGKRFRSLCKRLNCAGVLGVQVGRDAEKREHGRIRLSDMRESGDLESDLDQVAAIQLDHSRSNDDVDYFDLDILKARGARTGKTAMMHQKDYNLFQEV